MTDPGRADLRSLEPAESFVVIADRILAPALARSSSRVDVWVTLRYRARPLLAAAALLMLAALGALAALPARPPHVVANWLQNSHIPTNGELLQAFHGYRP